MALRNTTGTILSTHVISTVISAVTPLLFYEHPSGNCWSVQTHPSIFVRSSEFAFLQLVSIVSLLVIPFGTTDVFATVMYTAAVGLPFSSLPVQTILLLLRRFWRGVFCCAWYPCWSKAIQQRR